jgi:hypothetical protein
MLRDSVIAYSAGTPPNAAGRIALEASGRKASRGVRNRGTEVVPASPPTHADRFTHTADGWRFTERRAAVDLVGNVGHHLRLRP